MIGICLYFCPSPYNTKSEPQGKVWNLGDRMCQYMFIHGKKKKQKIIPCWSMLLIGSLCMCVGKEYT